MRTTDTSAVCVTVELFGHARLVCGVKQIDVDLPSESNLTDLANALNSAVPLLRGVVIDDSGNGFMSSYTANINGHSFLEKSSARVVDGDRIFVFSSQAGG